MLKEIKKEKLNKFLEDYKELCEKHGLFIDACGCCRSPWVVHNNDEKRSTKFVPKKSIEDNINHLREVTSKRGN